MTEEQIAFILDTLSNITQTTTSVNLKIHKRYTEHDLISARKEIETYIEDAEILSHLLIGEVSENSEVEINNTIYREINTECANIKNLEDNTTLNPMHRKMQEENCYERLFDCYNKLMYSFRTARRETKNYINLSGTAENTGIILLCKNVRIMEDLINKICSNNIDKSIIGGEQHFDSIRYGFEWLFCQEDLSNSNTRKQLDIRDCNRYLDYIKYQIMVASKYVESSPKAAIEIDYFFDKIRTVFDKMNFETRTSRINEFKINVKKLIEDFFKVYELLIKYRDALLREEEIRKSLAVPISDTSISFNAINPNIINLSSVAVRVLLDRFLSFVKISDLNFGNSTFNRAWFNYSELSKSNYAGSNFKYARIENAKMKECDISTSNLILADGGRTDFSYSNFNYSDLTGIDFADAIVNYCEFQNAIFMDVNIDNYKTAIQETVKGYNNIGDSAIKRARSLSTAWSADDVDDMSIENTIQIIIEKFQKIEPQLLIINQFPEKSWSILQYVHQSPDLLDEISFQMRKIVRKFLGKRISAELLYYSKELFSNQGSTMKAERISKYGNVLLDTANLTNVSAKYTQLGGSDLSHVTMNGASFENAHLSGVTMHYTKASATSFIYCNVNQAECFESDFHLANFSSAVLNNALFLNCNLNHTIWNKSIIVGTVFADFSFYIEENICGKRDKPLTLQIDQNIKFSNKDNRLICDIPNYNYNEPPIDKCSEVVERFWQCECSIKDAAFIDTLADSAVFFNIVADRTTFNRASFKNAFWANCRAYLSDFIETDFRYSSLLFCCMGQSNFTNANMTSTIIRYVDFSNCNLSSTLFNLSSIDHALFENANLRSMNFSGSVVNNSAFNNCKFKEVILSGATFNNCIFYEVDFINLYGFHSSHFQNCYFQECTFDGENIEDGVHDLVRLFSF